MPNPIQGVAIGQVRHRIALGLVESDRYSRMPKAVKRWAYRYTNGWSESSAMRSPDAASVRRYEDCPPWEKALRTIVLSGEMDIPVSALVLVARKALADCGVPYEEKPV